jgi:hypothetical protein
MRCSKARDFYFRNIDGLLNEAEKMRLQEHLDSCLSCASLATEMEECLRLLKELPEATPSGNFEWNLKRKILQEKSVLMRQQVGIPFRGWRWGLKFAASAAAVIIIALTSIWFTLESEDRAGPVVKGIAGEPQSTYEVTQGIPSGYGILDFSQVSYPARSRMVSGDVRYVEKSFTPPRQMPIQPTTVSREDSLTNVNEILWKRIETLERQLLLLQRRLRQERSRR